MKTVEINGWKIKFNAWQNKRIYVTVANKKQGCSEVGYYDIASSSFEEKKFKGMLSWGNTNVCSNFEKWIIEQCQGI